MSGARGSSMASSAFRLSPSAPPFTINRRVTQQLSVSSTLDDRHHENPSYDFFFSGVCLESDSGFDFGHPSASTALPLDGASSQTDYAHDSSGPESFLPKGESLLKLGMHAAKGLQPPTGTCAPLHRKYNATDFVASSSKGPHAALSVKDKDDCQDKSLTEKGKELEDYIFVQSPSTSKDEVLHQTVVSDRDLVDPLLIEKSDELVTHSNILANFTPDPHSTERGASAKNSLEPFDNYESDLIDSPCWVGTLSRSSPFPLSVSGPLSPPHKPELEGYKSLNPLAPKFIPGNAEGRVNQLMKSYYKEYALFSNLNSGSENCSTHMIQPTLMEDFFKYEGKFVTGDVVGGFVKSIKDASPNGSPCISSLAVEHISNFTSSGITVPTEVEGTVQGASNSYSGEVLNSMLDHSELLVQNLSNDQDSLGEGDLDILQRVVNNLHVCMRKWIGQRYAPSEPPIPGTSYYPSRTPTNSCKLTQDGDMVSRGTRMETVGNVYQFDDQNELEKQKSFSTVFSDRDYIVADSFTSRIESGFEKRDDATRVIEKFLKDNQQIDDELQPQAVLYKNLWLEAEAKLCSMKRKACVARMKTQMDGCRSDSK